MVKIMTIFRLLADSLELYKLLKSWHLRAQQIQLTALANWFIINYRCSLFIEGVQPKM